MTTQEIEIAIAATRGWKPSAYKDGRVSWWLDPTGSAWPDCQAPKYTERVGDILNWAKECLKGQQPKTFIRALVVILDQHHSNGEITLSDVCDPVEISYHILVATPMEFCEAFLRTLDLWKE